MGWTSRWPPYVPVAVRRRKAESEAKKHNKLGKTLKPARILGTKMACTFWGKAWCENLEEYSDFSNRLPRGRTYARNGSVIHLEITTGTIEALVSGSSLYEVTIKIDTLKSDRWRMICNECSGSIHSLMDLMQGKLSPTIMAKLCDLDSGMFPSPREIKLDCTCPDWSELCKHRAAVMYCIGNRLDTEPGMLFLLRGVDHSDLVDQALVTPSNAFESTEASLESDDLGALFGIELADSSSAKATPGASAAKSDKPSRKKLGAKPIVRNAPVEKFAAKKPAKKKAPTKKPRSEKVPPKKTSVKKTLIVDKAPDKKVATKRQKSQNIPAPIVSPPIPTSRSVNRLDESQDLSALIAKLRTTNSQHAPTKTSPTKKSKTSYRKPK
ncbi:MAG: SWIM zinc finger family protein [Pirellula sp.]